MTEHEELIADIEDCFEEFLDLLIEAKQAGLTEEVRPVIAAYLIRHNALDLTGMTREELYGALFE